MANSVRLIDGRTVSTMSEEWKIECLARSVAGRNHIEFRRQAMKHWQKKMPPDDFKNFGNLVAKIYNSEFSRVL